ncbi:MAG: restriction endonuclease subunit S [Prevotellaceae bacterium]|nr:restriction endonuclease subunit S [Prevotellaceae bacterium]
MKMMKCRLGDLVDITRGASLSSEYFATEGKYVRLTCGNFDYKNNCFKLNTSKDDLYYIGDFKPQFLMEEGDIITPLTEQAVGLLGSCAIIPEGGKYIQSQDVAKVVCKEGLIDKDFAFYLISSDIVKRQLSASAQQTKIRHTSPDKIKDCVVWLPSLQEQRSIGSFLRSIDRKIGVCRGVCRVLEGMARELYEYWFVQFDFPDPQGRPYRASGGRMTWNPSLKRDIPQGWSSGTLSDMANVTMGQSPDGSSYNDEGIGTVFYQGCSDFGIRFPKPRLYTTEPKRFAKKGEILMSVRAPVGTLNIANSDCCIGRGLSALSSKHNSMTYLYYMLDDLRAAFDVQNTSGTTFGSITKDELLNLPAILPANDAIEAFEKVCNPIFQKQMQLGEEIATLSRLRDELLPVLMSGQASLLP